MFKRFQLRIDLFDQVVIVRYIDIKDPRIKIQILRNGEILV